MSIFLFVLGLLSAAIGAINLASSISIAGMFYIGNNSSVSFQFAIAMFAGAAACQLIWPDDKSAAPAAEDGTSGGNV